jgi:hypothetical protein
MVKSASVWTTGPVTGGLAGACGAGGFAAAGGLAVVGAGRWPGAAPLCAVAGPCPIIVNPIAMASIVRMTLPDGGRGVSLDGGVLRRT